MKSDEGFAQVAGVELTLLDCARYFHKAGGINGIAQIAKDIGDKANARALADAAENYENSATHKLRPNPKQRNTGSNGTVLARESMQVGS